MGELCLFYSGLKHMWTQNGANKLDIIDVELAIKEYVNVNYINLQPVSHTMIRSTTHMISL